MVVILVAPQWLLIITFLCGMLLPELSNTLLAPELTKSLKVALLLGYVLLFGKYPLLSFSNLHCLVLSHASLFLRICKLLKLFQAEET